MLISNIPVFIRMGLSGRCVTLFFKIIRLFSENKGFSFVNLVKSGLHVIKNDRIKVYEGKFIVNSFIPPLNSKAFVSILTGVPGKGIQFFADHTSGRRKAPISVYIAATGRCMYNCWHCSAAGRNGGEEPDTGKMKGLINELQEMGVGIIGFTGGEPLLREDLEEVIGSIDERSVSFVFSTGYGLTLERARALKAAGLLGLAVSVDSADEMEHDRGRGYEGAFRTALEAIDNAKIAGLYTMSQTVCTRELLREDGLYRLAQLMGEHKVDEMRIIEPLPCGKLGSNEKVLLNEEESRKLIEFHISCNRNKVLPKASVFSYFESGEQFGCGAGVQHSYIDSRGNLYPCDFLPVNFGNVFEEPVAGIWNRLHEAVGVPGSCCFSKSKLKGILDNYEGGYPVNIKSLPENCCKCDNPSMPGFYRLLKNGRL